MRLSYAFLAAAILQLALPTHTILAQGSKKTSPTEINYNDLFKEAVADYNAQRNLEAKSKFTKILQRHPQHVQSQRHIALINNRLRDIAAIPKMKKQLSEITIKEIAFDDATLAEVMEFVTRQTKELSDGKVTVGFVIRGGDAVRERKLTFTTGAVPISTLVDAAAKLTNTKVEYTDYALTFTPLPTSEELSAIAAKKLDEAEAMERARAAAEAESADPFRKP